ncbi:H-2 class I histocompatibility antigen, Q10 alpha chain-like isoform X3 [Salvelinus fontinalis]|uniref:H-2 class I histocompatibility antigen, Q10 alpha chain-like isoform X3 n=1 Tax=Salvelinus fontinalis TaxID=8038 RepID=UPI0024869CF1|nr:H-2 class I histocompatibility antigen, Q10 alpha chain-like isoform X3 [Salvelinus fontinalis]
MYSFMLIVFYFSTECIVQSQSEIYSLNYIYTALSKPVELPGIHEFTAMGLMNDKQIDYYDSVDKKKIPKQDWMREKLPADYWEKGTQSRKSKEQWFKVNVNILMDRMRHNNTDVHILQWRHGCEIDKKPNDTLKFIKGTDQYSYDGDDFLAFDYANEKWVAPVNQAVLTKRKWDEVQILNQYTKGYLNKECVDWLSKFMEHGDKEFSSADSPPKISVFAKKANTAGNVRLTCMATGFYPKDVIIHIKKNGVQLTDKDGVLSTGARPNNDDTYQIRISVQIPEADKQTYECFVNHITLKETIWVKWDGTCRDCSQSTVAIIAIIIIVGAAAIGIIIVLFLWRKGKICAGKSGALPPTGIQAPLNGYGNGATNSNLTTTPSNGNGATNSNLTTTPSNGNGATNSNLTTTPSYGNGVTNSNLTTTPSYGNGVTNSNLTTTPSKYEDGSSNSSDSGQGSQKARSSDGASEEEVKMLLNGMTMDGASGTSSDSGQGSQKARSSDGASEEEVKMLLNGSG